MATIEQMSLLAAGMSGKRLRYQDLIEPNRLGAGEQA